MWPWVLQIPDGYHYKFQATEILGFYLEANVLESYLTQLDFE